MNDVTPEDLARGRKLKMGAIAAPILLTLAPALLTIVAWLLTVGGPPVAFVVLFAGIIATAFGFITGIIIAAILMRKRSVWTREMRELIAADGIKAEEINWFRNELKPSEKRALKAVEARDLMLADAYRETLASRLTATRIVKSSKRELMAARLRENSLRKLKSARSADFQAEIVKDIQKIGKINDEAKLMLAEAESRLQMIEAATSRSGILADNELALKKLTARAAELPLALESAKMTEEIKKELEAEDDKVKAIN
jgi:hypothetical protein